MSAPGGRGLEKAPAEALAHKESSASLGSRMRVFASPAPPDAPPANGTAARRPRSEDHVTTKKKPSSGVFERLLESMRGEAHDRSAAAAAGGSSSKPPAAPAKRQASSLLSVDADKRPDRKHTDDLTPANSRPASKGGPSESAKGPGEPCSSTRNSSESDDRFADDNTPIGGAPSLPTAATAVDGGAAAGADRLPRLGRPPMAPLEAHTLGRPLTGRAWGAATGAKDSDTGGLADLGLKVGGLEGGANSAAPADAPTNAPADAVDTTEAATEVPEGGSMDASGNSSRPASLQLAMTASESTQGAVETSAFLIAAPTLMAAAADGEANALPSIDDDSDVSAAGAAAEAADEAGDLPDLSPNVNAAATAAGNVPTGGRGRSRSRGHSSHRQPHSLLADTDSESDLSADGEFNHAVRTDRFGFFETSDRAGAQLPPGELVRRAAKETERAGKWLPMYWRWDKTTTKSRRRRRLKRRVRKGVPDALRGEVWQLLSGAKAALASNPGRYRQLLEQEHVRVDGPIEEDIPRTMYDHEMFCRHSRLKGRLKLRRVLTAYGRYDREVQYCQGINYICAMFLLYMPEEEAFWQLVCVMHRPAAPMRELFLPGMVAAQEFQYVIDSLTDKYAPRICRQVSSFGLTPSMYATQWFLTGFTQRFPYDLVTRLWDIFLLEDWKIMYRVCLALFRHAEPAVAGLEIEPMNLYLRDLPTAVDGATVIAIAFDIPLKHRHIEKRRRAFWEERGVPWPGEAAAAAARKEDAIGGFVPGPGGVEAEAAAAAAAEAAGS